jgi:cell wall-associated NlpC family hydrolase
LNQQGNEYVGLDELVKVLGYQVVNEDGVYTIGDTGAEYELKLNQAQALKQGENITLSNTPISIKGKPYLPIAIVTELFGQDMSYEFADGQLKVEVIGAEDFQKNENTGLYGDVYDFADDPTDPYKNVDIISGADVSGGTLQAQALKNISIRRLLTTARRYLGVRYVFGSEYPNNRTFDCSSYTQYVFAKHGIKLPRTARSQGKVGKTVSRKSLRKGDLLFFYIPGRFKSKNIPGHVGIYIGNGRMIHALNEPKDGVQYRSINRTFWKKNFLWAKRVAY